MRLRFLILIVGGILFQSCEPTVFFQESVELNENGWLQTDTTTFAFDIQDTAARYDLKLFIDHSDQYEYQNLYIQLITGFPNRDPIDKVLSVDLADPQGRWYGHCRGANCRVEILLQQNAYFQTPGQHQLSILQHMRVDPLENISGLALHLEVRDPAAGLDQ